MAAQCCKASVPASADRAAKNSPKKSVLVFSELLFLICQRFLHMKTIIAFIAIQAQLPVTRKSDPVCAGGFAAAVAGIGRKETGRFRHCDGGFLHIEHFFRLASLIIGKGSLSGHALRLRFQHQTDGFSGLAVVERICGLTAHMEQQISLTDAAAQHHLNGIHTAGIVFRDTNNLLVG